MDGYELSQHLKTLGYSRSRFSRMFDKNPETITRQCSGMCAVNGFTAAIVEFLLDHPEYKPYFENRRPYAVHSTPRATTSASEARKAYKRKWMADKRAEQKRKTLHDDVPDFSRG